MSLQQRYLSLLRLRRQRVAEINARLAAVRRAIRKRGGRVPRSPDAKRRTCLWCGVNSVTTRSIKILTKHSKPRKGRRDACSWYTSRRVMLCQKCWPRKSS